MRLLGTLAVAAERVAVGELGGGHDGFVGVEEVFVLLVVFDVILICVLIIQMCRVNRHL